MNAPANITATVRHHIIGENNEYTRYSDGRLRVFYHWGHNNFRADAEIIPVGKRFALILSGKPHHEIIGGCALLDALKDFRRQARVALDDLRIWHREFE